VLTLRAYGPEDQAARAIAVAREVLSLDNHLTTHSDVAREFEGLPPLGRETMTPLQWRDFVNGTRWGGGEASERQLDGNSRAKTTSNS
jgi:hypothetical protein